MSGNVDVTPLRLHTVAFFFGKYRLEYDRSIGFGRVFWAIDGGGELHCGYFLRKCKGKWYHQNYFSPDGMEQGPHAETLKDIKTHLEKHDA